MSYEQDYQDFVASLTDGARDRDDHSDYSNFNFNPRPTIDIPPEEDRFTQDSRFMCEHSDFAHQPEFPAITDDDYQYLMSHSVPHKRSRTPTGYTPVAKRQVELVTTEKLEDSPQPDPVPVPEPQPVPDAPRPKAGSFRLNVKNIFCTWPQCDTSKDTLMTNIKNCTLWKDTLLYAIACQEDHHESDGVHCHALVMLTKRVNIKSMEKLNALASKHGDYKTARDVAASIKYIKKDGNFIEHGDCPRKLDKEKVSDVIVKMVHSHQSLRQIEQAQPAAVLLNQHKIQDYIALHDHWAAQDALPALKPYDPVDTLTCGAGWDQVFQWCNDNLQGQPRVHRQRQLYLWGDTGLGKSLLTLWVQQFCRVYTMPHSQWMEGFDPTFHQVAVCDDFNACYTIAWINEVHVT